MKTSGKILKYPYHKEYVLEMIEDCFAFIESHCIINSIPTPKILFPIGNHLSYIFANNPPSSWTDLISHFLDTPHRDRFNTERRPYYLKEVLYAIKKEVMSNEQ